MIYGPIYGKRAQYIYSDRLGTGVNGGHDLFAIIVDVQTHDKVR